MRTATLAGTRLRPELLLRFGWGEEHPMRRGALLKDWVRSLPGRRWDSSRKCWVVTGTGPEPTTLLRRAGFATELSLLDEWGVDCLDDLAFPLARLHPDRPGWVQLLPRLAGWPGARDLLGPAATMDDRGVFCARALELAGPDGEPKDGVVLLRGVADAVGEAVEARRRALAARTDVDDHAAIAGLATGIGLGAVPETRARLEAATGGVPDWFSLPLFEYQRLGALSVVAGHRLLADEPGLGKTNASLAAAAIVDARRLLVVVPPIVTTQWVDTITASGLADAAHVVLFKSGRKEPVLPQPGNGSRGAAAVISDDLLKVRPGIADALAEWGPDVVIYDEAHRSSNVATARFKALASLHERTPAAMWIPVTGTPMFTRPQEFVPTLILSGHLEVVFGGSAAFLETYCTKDPWGGWKPRRKKLPQLRALLDEHVWVRRRQSDVQSDLPGMSWQARVLDVDLRGYRAAHAEVAEKVGEWLDSFEASHDRLPDTDDVKAWAKQSIGLSSPLRKAAGLAKVEPAAAHIADWLAWQRSEGLVSRGADGAEVWDRPLLVWCWHREVMDAVEAASREAVGGSGSTVRRIDGGTSMRARDEAVREWQAGRVPVMVAQIKAAGVGLTLVRGCDALFVETEWNSELMAQAEARLDRIGQTRPVRNTILVAVETLDENMNRGRARKARVAAAVTDRDGAAREAALETGGDERRQWELVASLVEPLLAKRRRRR